MRNGGRPLYPLLSHRWYVGSWLRTRRSHVRVVPGAPIKSHYLASSSQIRDWLISRLASTGRRLDVRRIDPKSDRGMHHCRQLVTTAGFTLGGAILTF